MSLRVEELTLIAAEFSRELAGAVVQRVHAPSTTRVYVELRIPGRSVTILLCSEVGFTRVSAVEQRPHNPPTPPTWQSVLRTDLTGARLADTEFLPARRTFILHFGKEGKFHNLVLECTNEPTLVLCNAAGRIRCVSNPKREALRVGSVWTALEEQPLKASPSRLIGDHVVLRLAHAAESLLSTTEIKAVVDSRKAPLLAKLKRLQRTKEKVKAESERTDRALSLRREGELLTQNLHLLKRGLSTIALTEYLEDGTTRTVELTLDPSKSPQQLVEHRFHQYKRLLRGTEVAKRRLDELEQEGRALEAQLAELDANPPDATQLAQPRARAPKQERLPPYREYRAHGGQRIWVGRGSAHNDDLTFHVARPFHVWFHARGVPGAHVVVPLEKNAQLHPEVLLDAAHLAAHHSDAKGEPRVEVSYTDVKFVQKPKGAPSGAVSFTREKTLMLRFEADRLKRLVATEESA